MNNIKISRYEQEDDNKNGYVNPRYNQQRTNGGRYINNNRQRNSGNRSGLAPGGMGGAGAGGNSMAGSFSSSNSNFDIDGSSWRRRRGFLFVLMGR